MEHDAEAANRGTGGAYRAPVATDRACIETSTYLRWINVATGANVRLVTVEEICYFRAEAKYTYLVTADQAALIRTPLKELLEALDPSVFWQIHRSTIVNVNAIEEVTRDMRGHLLLRLKSRKEALPVVSRSRTCSVRCDAAAPDVDCPGGRSEAKKDSGFGLSTADVGERRVRAAGRFEFILFSFVSSAIFRLGRIVLAATRGMRMICRMDMQLGS